MVKSSTFLGHNKSKSIYNLLYWFKSYGNFPGLGSFCLVVKFHQGGSNINGATPYRFYGHNHLFQPSQPELVGDPKEGQADQEGEYSDSQEPLPFLAHMSLHSHPHHSHHPWNLQVSVINS